MRVTEHNPARSLLTERWMSAAIVIITLLFLSVNWYYYARTRSALDEEFSVRLRALASLAASAVDPAEVDTHSPEFSGFVEDHGNSAALDSLASGFDLSSIQVLRDDGVVLLTTRPDLFPPGEPYPMWNMDYGAIIKALEGSPSSTGLYRSPGGGYIKAGYAPLRRFSGKAGMIVAAEADARFLEGMGDLRTLLIIATTVSIAGLALFLWLVSKAAGSLIKARESLLHSETLASMGRMATGIAHEVRNPLFIIRSGAENLGRKHPEDSEDIKELITDEVDRLDGILTDYLMFARNESLRVSEADLVSLLDRSVRLVSDSAESGDITFDIDHKVEKAPLMCEERKIQQVFLNIILNAIQAMDGSGKLSVTLSRDRTEYVIEFSDSGPGVPERELERVFEPFYTTRPKGSGLGLAIARRVVEDHGGTIGLASGPAGGTEVTVTLPARQPHTGSES